MIATPTPMRFLKVAALAFVFWIVWLILTPYPSYLPPDFEKGFLRNKSDFFFRAGYFVGFYAHIVAAPVGLLCGGLQFSRTIRLNHPGVHRLMGRVYVEAIL